MSSDRVLLSFVGNRDPFREEQEPGPLLSLLEHREYTRVVVLCTGPEYLDRAKGVQKESEERIGPLGFDLRMVELESVVDYQEILTRLTETVEQIKRSYGHRTPAYEILLDPGTPQMQTVWFILAQRRVIDATLLQGVPPHLAGGRYRVKEIDPLPLIQEGYALAGPEEPDAAERPVSPRARSVAPSGELRPIIGESKALRQAIDMAKNAAAYELPMLIRGETGTGKELFARLIHREGSRRGEIFAPFNCSAIPEGMAESTLFGHTRGAFTDAKEARPGIFRSASGGTLFLDEIGDLPLPVQPKLLRVLEEQLVTPAGADRAEPVDLHILAATNRPLEDLVAEGSFRQDLLARISQIVIEIPPLRERSEDIPLLSEYFLRRWNSTYGEERQLSSELLELFLLYPWPGNVRELQATLQQLCATQTSRELTTRTLPPALQRHFGREQNSPGAGACFELPDEGIDLKAYLFQIEKHYYDLALKRSENSEQAARLLGLKGPAFRKALRERFGHTSGPG